MKLLQQAPLFFAVDSARPVSGQVSVCLRPLFLYCLPVQVPHLLGSLCRHCCQPELASLCAVQRHASGVAGHPAHVRVSVPGHLIIASCILRVVLDMFGTCWQA